MDNTIKVYKTGKNIVDFQSFMQSTDQFYQIHSPFSKIKAILIDFSNGTGDARIEVSANMDVTWVKYVAKEILAGSENNFSFEKINKHIVSDDGRSPVSKMAIEYNSNMKLKWSIAVENGTGIVQQNPNGGCSCKAGSYVCDAKVKVFMSEDNMKMMFGETLDAIRDFEFIVRQENSSKKEYKKQ